jgi:hypothetical protein
MFFTFEIVLMSARFFASKETQRFQFPEMVKPAMITFGFNPTFYENLISNLWGYYEMYNTFMADMYIVIVLMGLAVAVASIANYFELCV